MSLQLFALLSQSSSTASAASIYTQLAALDRQLAGLIPIIAAHQERQRTIERLIRDLSATEQAWQDGVRVLHKAKTELEPVVRSGLADKRSIERSAHIKSSSKANGSESTLTPATILSYARLLAPFTSAPPSSLLLPDQQLLGDGAGPHLDPTGTRLPQGAWPPFPTEGAMRRGRLQFGKQEPALGESGEVGGELDRARGWNPSLKRFSLSVIVQRDQREANGAGASGAAGTTVPPAQDAASKLAQVAKQQQRRERAQAEQAMAQEDFTFDLDLNPDL